MSPSPQIVSGRSDHPSATVGGEARQVARFVKSAVAAVVVVGLSVAGCGVGRPRAASTSGPATAVTAAPAPGPAPRSAPELASGPRIVLRFGEEMVAATLVDTAAAREFSGLLPLTVELHDPMGQAKSGQLPPSALDTAGAATVLDPDTGGIYYVPDRAMIAIYYDDLGHSVPPPGLVPLGSLESLNTDIQTGTNTGTETGTETGGPAGKDAAVAAVADAGNRTRVVIDLVDRGMS